MKLIKPITLAAAILSPLFPIASMAGDLDIIPLPQSTEAQEGKGYTITGDTVIYADKDLIKEAQFLAKTLQTPTGYSLKVKEAEGKSDNSTINAGITLSKNEKPDEELGKEGYTLKVTDTGISIQANTATGAFYGIQTVLQMLPAEVHGSNKAEIVWDVPAVSISDSPRFAWRAYMLDEARNFHGMEEVKRLLDVLAAYKMNVFQWHLTDDQGWRIEIKKYPKLTSVGSMRKDSQRGGWKSPLRSGEPHGGFYTQEQIKEVIAYAEERHITIVPEIGMPGHCSAWVASYPEMGMMNSPIEVVTSFGKHPALLNVADEKLYTMISDVMDEVFALFPSQVIHIGGDEVRTGRWQSGDKKDQISELMKREGLETYHDVQIYFTNRVSDMFKEKGRSVMGWNEILGGSHHGGDGTKKNASTLSTDAVVQFWKGSLEEMVNAAAKGHECVNSSCGSTYLDYTYGKISIERAYKFNPIPRGMKPEHESKVKGFGCQMWGEWIPTVERMHFQTFPRLGAFAETGWTNIKNKDYDGFMKRIHKDLKRLDARDLGYAQGVLTETKYQNEDFDSFTQIGAFDARRINENFILDWDASEVVKGNGKYEVASLATGGKHSLAIVWMALYEDGKEIGRDPHPSQAHPNNNINNVYRFEIKDFKPGAKYEVKAEVDKIKGAKVDGCAKMRLVPAE